MKDNTYYYFELNVFNNDLRQLRFIARTKGEAKELISRSKYKDALILGKKLTGIKAHLGNHTIEEQIAILDEALDKHLLFIMEDRSNVSTNS